MDLFNRFFLDNSIGAYCIVGGIILLMLIIKKYLSRYIASLLFRLVHRTWKNISKKDFIDLLVAPLQGFLLIVIIVFTLDKLNFPSDFQYKIYGHSTEEIVNKTGIGLIIVYFTWFLMRAVDFIAVVLEQNASLTIEKEKDQLVVFFRDFLKVIISIAGLLLVIKACFSQPIGNLLTSLSIVGAVLALAAKESLENLIASFIIFFDKPFTTGDLLKVNAVTGTVEKIGLRSTRIRTADKTLVTVPNKQMVDSVVDNWSMRTQRRAEIKLELNPSTKLAASKNLTTEIKKYLGMKPALIASFSVYFSEINKGGLVIMIEYFTNPIAIEEFNSIKEDFNFFLKKILEENELALAVTANTVTIINEPKAEG
ncbi:MAG TPA: mechanosensitive ion channel family protein [Ferruginibacter sp.]|nr:mechanosensitive ion channel family protein [Ferruginibacter sp.]